MALLTTPLPADTPLSTICNNLKVPNWFRNSGEDDEAVVIATLEEWRRKAYVVLSDFKTRLQDKQAYTLDEQGEILSAVAPFEGNEPWVAPESRDLARGILEPYQNADFNLLKHLLTRKIRPVFQKNPHPELNMSTGRKMSRSAGGSIAFQDHFEGQSWKKELGIVDLLAWCVRQVQSGMYEKLWHLIIPPLMTIMDDFEVYYKLRGTQIVSEMLRQVPAEILRRTGVDGLLFANLTKAIAFLDRPESPALLRTVIQTSIDLVELTTPPKSVKRFDQLCALLGDGVIGTVWMHGIRQDQVMLAAVRVIPTIVKALGLGCAQYLKALIPQLVHPLLPGPQNTADIPLQTASAQALCVVITECSPRMMNWKGTILDGVCRCWVTLVESGPGSAENENAKAGHVSDQPAEHLKIALQDICHSLREACPSVAEDEFRRLLKMDERIFKPLVQTRAGDR